MITNTMIARNIRRMLSTPVRVKLYVGVPNEFAMVEASGGGYRDVVLTSQDWRIRTDVATPVAEADLINFRFDGTREMMIGGAFIVDDRDGSVLWVQEFEAPGLKIARTGDTIPVQPRFMLSALGNAAV